MLPSGRLTTHVLDVARGRPAEGVGIELRVVGEPGLVARATTNADGRTDAPLLADGLRAVTYELAFDVAAHLAGEGLFDVVPVRFRVRAPGEHHHVPLLLSPWSYSTYRGS